MTALEFHRVPVPKPVNVAGFNVDLPAYLVVAMNGAEVAGAGGLAWSNGRCWLFLETVQPVPFARFRIISEARKMMRKAAQLGETEVYVARDRSFSTSARLLRLLKFEPFGVELGEEIWVCQV